MSTTDIMLNALAATLRGWRGTNGQSRVAIPAKAIKLYDIEADPYCRLVREVICELDLDVLVLPCPINGMRFRPEAYEAGGKRNFPLLVDENTSTVISEWANIISYLHATYGRDGSSSQLRRIFALASSFASSACMLRASGLTGAYARLSKAPKRPLELYSFESSPYSKPVRARLCELEIPYMLRTTGKGSWRDWGTPIFRDRLWKSHPGTTRNRRKLLETTGRVQVPYLADPNTNSAMYESKDILHYLDCTYAR